MKLPYRVGQRSLQLALGAAILALSSTSLAQSQLAPTPASVAYTVDLSSPEQHLVEVHISLPAGPGQRELQLPVWNALYQVRDFAQFVNWVRAKDRTGKSLAVRELDKSSWQLEGAEGGAIASFTYVYANPALTSELASCGITPGFANQDRCANHPEEASETNYGLSAQADLNLGASTLTSIFAYRRDETGPDSQDIQAVPQEIPQIWSTGALSAARQY